MEPRVMRIATHRWTNRYQVVLPAIPEHGVRSWVVMVDAVNEEKAIAKAISCRPVEEHFKHMVEEI